MDTFVIYFQYIIFSILYNLLLFYWYFRVWIDHDLLPTTNQNNKGNSDESIHFIHKYKLMYSFMVHILFSNFISERGHNAIFSDSHPLSKMSLLYTTNNFSVITVI